MKISTLVELSNEATEINDVISNHGNLIFMATEIYVCMFAVDGIQTLYLEHMSHGATTISGSTCCFGNLIAMAAENYFCYSGM